MVYIFTSHVFILLCVLDRQFLCADSNAIKHILNKILNSNDAVRSKAFRGKPTIDPSDVNYFDYVPKKRHVSNWPEQKKENLLPKSIPIQNEFKVRKLEPACFKNRCAAVATSGPAAWHFGGTWSSAQAGVRFDMDGRGTVGVDKNMHVKILDRAADEDTESTGFLDKDWLAKASAPHGRRGPFALFAVNRRDRTVAVFVGFAHSQNNKDFVTGMWSLGKDCRNNLDTHPSVFNIPDVLCRDSN